MRRATGRAGGARQRRSTPLSGADFWHRPPPLDRYSPAGCAWQSSPGLPTPTGARGNFCGLQRSRTAASGSWCYRADRRRPNAGAHRARSLAVVIALFDLAQGQGSRPANVDIFVFQRLRQRRSCRARRRPHFGQGGNRGLAHVDIRILDGVGQRSDRSLRRRDRFRPRPSPPPPARRDPRHARPLPTRRRPVWRRGRFRPVPGRRRGARRRRRP